MCKDGLGVKSQNQRRLITEHYDQKKMDYFAKEFSVLLKTGNAIAESTKK